MRRVCAWCGVELAPGQDRSDLVVTHGICPECSDHFFGEPDLPPLRRFLDRLQVPVLLVTGGGKVLTANEPARRLLGRDLPEIEGLPGGEVMECAYARLPGGCGGTEHCPACTIRSAVLDTFATGRSRERLPAVQRVAGQSGVEEVTLLISTERVGETVLLRIDERPAAAPGGPIRP